jgi:uncharacterized protein (TIGR03435 family)
VFDHDAGLYIGPAKQAGGSETGTDHFWALEGFPLKMALARVCAAGELPFPEALQALFPTMESVREAMRGASFGAMSIANGSMEMFCQTLEEALGRPVVDETGLDGHHDIELPDGPGDIAERLRRELGLELTPARRPVPWVIVRDALR